MNPIGKRPLKINRTWQPHPGNSDAIELLFGATFTNVVTARLFWESKTRRIELHTALQPSVTTNGPTRIISLSDKQTRLLIPCVMEVSYGGSAQFLIDVFPSAGGRPMESPVLSSPVAVTVGTQNAQETVIIGISTTGGIASLGRFVATLTGQPNGYVIAHNMQSTHFITEFIDPTGMRDPNVTAFPAKLPNGADDPQNAVLSVPNDGAIPIGTLTLFFL